MAETTARRQPARPPGGGPRAAAAGPVRLRELPFLTQLNLRLDPAGPAAGAVGGRLGAALPTRANTAVAAGERDGALARARRVAGGRPREARRRSLGEVAARLALGTEAGPSSTSRRTGRRSSSRAPGPRGARQGLLPGPAPECLPPGFLRADPARRRRRCCCCAGTTTRRTGCSSVPRSRPTWPTGSWTRAVSTQKVTRDDQRLRPVLCRHRAVELAHRRADAGGAARSPGARRRRTARPGRRACASSCSARSAPPATGTAASRRVVLGLEGERPEMVDPRTAQPRGGPGQDTGRLCAEREARDRLHRRRRGAAPAQDAALPRRTA